MLQLLYTNLWWQSCVLLWPVRRREDALSTRQ